MNKVKFILFIICVGLLGACNHIDRKIIKYVQTSCPNNDTCHIDLREVLKVDYDCMYLFGEFTQPDEISSIMGIPYESNKTITDSKYRVILLKDSNVVYEDEFHSHTMYFYRITDRIDTTHIKTFYLVHYSPYYLVIKEKDDYGEFYYCLLTISNKPQYRRAIYDYEKGYTFEEVVK